MSAAPPRASQAPGRPDVPAEVPEAPDAPVPSSAGALAAPASGVFPAVPVPELCSHGLPLEGTEECRRCLAGGFLVSDFLAAFPEGAELPEIAAVLGVTKQGVQQAERRALAKLLPLFVRLYPDLAASFARGPRLNTAQRFAAIVRRMLRDGFESDEIADNLNEPQWRVRRAIESKGA